MTVAKKIGAKQLKKMHLIKMTGAKKIWTKQCTIKKNPYKNDCCQKKIGTNQLQKMATYKNDCAQKNLNQTT